MNRQFGVSTVFLAGLMVTLVAALPLAHAAPGQGVPFQQLQDQIDGLQAQVQALAEQFNHGGDQLVEVNCVDNSISGALAQARPGGMFVVTVTGTCTENVTITRDDVLLQGGSGAVVGQITVDGARRVVIHGLTVSGPGNGIEARRNAVVTVESSLIENNAVSGIDVRQGAFATIDGNMIRSNAQCEVLVRDSGHVRLLNNVVESSSEKPPICNALIGVFRDSRVRMGGNAVTNNAPSGFAVDVEHGSTFRQDLGHDLIAGAVRVLNMGNADFRDAEINGSIQVVETSNLRVRNSALTGFINIAPRSLAVFNSSATVDGIVNCQGSGTVGLGPKVGLTLVDSLSGPVRTSAGGIGWAFRAAVFGEPTFVGGGGFNGCN